MVTGIRFEGQPPQRPTGAGPPPGTETQLSQAVGGDPYGGLSVAQLNAIQGGAVGYRNVVTDIMNQHAANAAAHTRQGMQASAFGTSGAGFGMAPNQSGMNAGFGGFEALQHLRNIDQTERQILAVQGAAYNFQRTLHGGAGFGGGMGPGGPGAGFGGGGGPFFGSGHPAYTVIPPGGGGGGGGGGGPPGISGMGGPGGNNWFWQQNNNAASFRGGGGGFGGGGGGGGRLPFVGGMGFPNLGRMGGALPGVIGVAAGLLEEAVFAPQIIGGAVHSAMGSAEPYMDITQRSYNFARAVGGQGDPALRSVFPGGYQVPPWMKALGLTPQSATELTEKFGILPNGVPEREDLTRSLAEMPLTPGFAGIGAQGQAAARQAALYGASQPGAAGVRDFTMNIGPIMENAFVRGMDRVEILKSIDRGIGMAARGGAVGVDAESMARFLMQFQGMPGGRTGEAGLSAMEGLEGARQSIGTNPLRTQMAANFVRGITTEDQLKQKLGGDVFGQIKQLGGGAAGQKMIDDFLRLNRSGQTLQATQILNSWMTLQNGLEEKVFTQPEFYSQFGGGPGQTSAEAAVMNLSPTQRYVQKYGRPDQAGIGPITEQTMFKGGDTWKYYEGKEPEYRQGLLRMGVRPELIEATIKSAKARNIDPRLGGAFMMNESSGGSATNMKAYDMPANLNPMQIAGSSGMPKPSGPGESIDEGFELLARAMNQPGANLSTIGSAYAGPQNFTSAYRNRLVTSLNKGDVGELNNIPTDVFARNAEAGQIEMAASAVSFAELNKILPLAQGALEGFTSAVNRAATALSGIHTQSDAPWIGRGRPN